MVVHKMFGNKCALCGEHGTDAHHLIKRRFLGYRWIASNGVLLCRTCHDWAELHETSFLEELQARHPKLYDLYAARNKHAVCKVSSSDYELLETTLRKYLARDAYSNLWGNHGSAMIFSPTTMLASSIVGLVSWQLLK
jgi:hypothetical protein